MGQIEFTDLDLTFLIRHRFSSMEKQTNSIQEQVEKLNLNIEQAGGAEEERVGEAVDYTSTNLIGKKTVYYT